MDVMVAAASSLEGESLGLIIRSLAMISSLPCHNLSWWEEELTNQNIPSFYNSVAAALGIIATRQATSLVDPVIDSATEIIQIVRESLPYSLTDCRYVYTTMIVGEVDRGKILSGWLKRRDDVIITGCESALNEQGLGILLIAQ
jgi:hypothetical protein